MTSSYDTPRSLGDTDAPHSSPVTPSEDVRTVLINRISWGAVLAGVVVALVVQLLLNMLGLGIGAATLQPMSGDNPEASTLSIGAGIWWTVSGIIASFLAGLAAGRLSGRPKESTASWHGLIAWALTTLIIALLLTSAIGSVVGGALSAIGGTAGGIGRAATSVAGSAATGGQDPFSAIERQVREATGGNDPAALRDAAVASVKAAITGDPAQAQQARERAAQALARAQSISVEDARAEVGRYEQQYRQTVEKAKQQTEKAAAAATKAASRGAIFGFIALVLGGIAAWFGGRTGAVDPTVTGLPAGGRMAAARREP